MNLLDVTHLSISFGGLKAVDDFNIQIKKGELYGLIGPNGAGKTTVFNLLTGVYKPGAGSIVLALSLPACTDLAQKADHFADIADAVHVKMPQRPSPLIILLYNGKGRAAHRFFNAKSLGKSLGKYGFPNPQVPVQAVDLAGPGRFSQPFSQVKGIFPGI